MNTLSVVVLVAALACANAGLLAAPAPVALAAPVAIAHHPHHFVAPLAVPHPIVYSAPVVKHIAYAAPVIKTVAYAAPVVKTVAYASPVVYAAAPVVKHHVAVAAPAYVSAYGH